MDRELIERLAHEAGFSTQAEECGICREDGEPDVYVGEYPCGTEAMRFAALIAEECAKVAEGTHEGGAWFNSSQSVWKNFNGERSAAAIRAKFAPPTDARSNDQEI